MAINLTEEGIILSGAVDMESANELKSALLYLLKRDPEKGVVDAAEVTEIDTAALQVLLSARISWEKQGGEMIINNPSDALVKEEGILGGFLL